MVRACCLPGEDWCLTVTFPTPPERGYRGVHVLSYVTRTSQDLRAIQVIIREKQTEGFAALPGNLRDPEVGRTDETVSR